MAVRREVEVYGDWPDHPEGRGRWTCGSGFLLAGRLVLTAAHVVCPAGGPLATVKVRGESGGLVDAAVVWQRWVDDVDVALLEITGRDWVEPVWRHPVRWGRLVTTRAGQGCEATGFPAVVATPRRRETHHAIGVVNPRSLVKSGLYAVEVTNPPAEPGPDGSGWRGMCGAAVLCRGLLVGIVTVDPAGFASRRLITVPITAVAADPGFARVVAEHTGRTPIVEPVELAGLAEPVSLPASPAELLRADAATAPFRARPELEQLRLWCQSEQWSGVRLVVGAGGQGKTRLARHLAGSLTGRGWATLVLGEHATSEDIAVLAQVAVPTLVVVDYAEGRTAQLDPLIAALDQAEAKVRLLLLARTAGAWRTDRVAPVAHLSVLADERIVVSLGPVEPDPDGRRRAWREAVDALASRLAVLDTYQGIAWPDVAAGMVEPILDGERFRTILAVQMHALAALLHAGDPVPTTTDAARDAQAVLLEHEARYWSRVADRFGITLAPATRRFLVATATLWGASTREEAHRVLATAVGPATPDVVTNAADWLATLYRDSGRYWSGLQPDPLGEYFIGTTLGPGGDCPALISGPMTHASPGQLEQALTVLGRAHPRHPHLAEVITDTVLAGGVAGARAAVAVAPRLEQPQPVLAALDRFVDAAGLAQLDEVDAVLPRFSLLLTQTTLRTATARVRLLRVATDQNRETYLPALAGSVNNLALRLADVGRRVEGLAAAREAAEFYYELARTDLVLYGPRAERARELVASMGGE